MGFGKVAPAPLRLVCAKAALTSRVRHRNTFRERITWFPPEDWRYDFHPCFYPEFITVWLHRSEFHVKTEGWIGSLRGFLPPFQLFNEHLLDRLIVGAQDVPDAVSAHQVANLFGKVLGMVSRSFQRLRHKQHMEALLARRALAVLQVAQEDQVAQTIELRIRAQDPQSLVEVPLAEGIVYVPKHLLEP